MSRQAEICDAAERVLEAEGSEAVTMRRVAAELGIRAPSLYKHVGGKDDIEAALQERGLQSLAGALAESLDLLELARAYRAWALAHPQLYELVARRRLRRERLTDGVEDAAAQALLRRTGGDLDLSRALWGLAHGLVDLELADRFPAGADIDAVWARALEVFAQPTVSAGRRTRS